MCRNTLLCGATDNKQICVKVWPKCRLKTWAGPDGYDDHVSKTCVLKNRQFIALKVIPFLDCCKENIPNFIFNCCFYLYWKGSITQILAVCQKYFHRDKRSLFHGNSTRAITLQGLLYNICLLIWNRIIVVWFGVCDEVTQYLTKASSSSSRQQQPLTKACTMCQRFWNSWLDEWDVPHACAAWRCRRWKVIGRLSEVADQETLNSYYKKHFGMFVLFAFWWCYDALCSISVIKIIYASKYCLLECIL